MDKIRVRKRQLGGEISTWKPNLGGGFNDIFVMFDPNQIGENLHHLTITKLVVSFFLKFHLYLKDDQIW